MMTRERLMSVKPGLMLLVALLGVIVLASGALADRLILKDGRSFKGRVLSEDDSTVVFEAVVGRSKARLTFPLEKVERIEKGEIAVEPPPPSQEPKAEETPEKPGVPGYFVIPVKDVIGVSATAPILEKCLNIAKRMKPEVVILKINSGGGSVRELQQMIKVLEEHKDMRFVAYVEKAYSAAAVLAMSCKEIIAEPKGTIGGAVVFRVGPFGMPMNIEEKFESILRAEFRTAVVSAGHNPLLLEGMMNADCVLSLRKTEKGPEVVKGIQRDAKVIKPRGRILTMTAEEAVDCGLVMASVEKLEDCNKALGMDKWRALPDVGIRIVAAWEKDVERVEAEYKKLSDEIEQLFVMARANDPNRFTYVVTRTGRYTIASKKKWQKHAKICVGCLNRIGQKLERLKKIAADYEGLVGIGKIDHSEETLQDLQNQISAISKSIRSTTPR